MSNDGINTNNFTVFHLYMIINKVLFLTKAPVSFSQQELVSLEPVKVIIFRMHDQSHLMVKIFSSIYARISNSERDSETSHM